MKFAGYPDFRPNLTPLQVLKRGSFGGTYFRPIYSTVTNAHHKNAHRKYGWDLPANMLTNAYSDYDKNINTYGVKVGQTLEYWENSGWIHKQDPYGWFQWYCEFYNGRRTADDERQIKRWLGVAGPNGRFRRRLINMIHKAGRNDESISPAIRQTLQHWGYRITAADIKN